MYGLSNGQIASLIANLTTKSNCCKPVSSGSFGLPGGESWHGVVPEWVSEPDTVSTDIMTEVKRLKTMLLREAKKRKKRK